MELLKPFLAPSSTLCSWIAGFVGRGDALDHDGFGRNQSKTIVIDSQSSERYAGGKPLPLKLTAKLKHRPS
jgi:hypothetical protein